MLQYQWLVDAQFCGHSEFELTYPNQIALHWLVKSKPLCETVQLTLKVSLQTLGEGKHEKSACFQCELTSQWHGPPKKILSLEGIAKIE